MPDELVSSISPSRVAMLGTNGKSVRCTSLEGEVGKGTSCTIYEQRSSTCRDFEASWTDGQHNPDCDSARAAFGLLAICAPPVNDDDWNLLPDDAALA